MNFTGRNLQLVHLSISYALMELHNEVAMCPNQFEYEQSIEEIEELSAELEVLQEKIEASPHFTFFESED